MIGLILALFFLVILGWFVWTLIDISKAKGLTPPIKGLYIVAVLGTGLIAMIAWLFVRKHCIDSIDGNSN